MNLQMRLSIQQEPELGLKVKMLQGKQVVRLKSSTLTVISPTETKEFHMEVTATRIAG